MNKLVLVLLFLPCCFANALSETTKFEKENYIYARLLLADTNTSLKAAARTLYDREVNDVDLLDLVAEVLNENLQVQWLGEESEDAIAWLVNVLGKSGNKRYEQFVRSILDVDIGSKLIRRKAKRALAGFSGDVNEPFSVTPGLLENLRENTNHTLARVSGVEAKISLIDIGDGLERVLEMMGLPDDIVMHKLRVVNIRTRYVKAPGMTLSYHGVGIVYLSYKRRGIAWSTDITSNVYALTENVADQNAVDLVEVILSDDWLKIIKTLNLKTAEKDIYPKFIYDIAMEKLLGYSKKRVFREQKMLASLANFIGTSKNIRYEEAMVSVSKRSTSNLVRMVARKALYHLKLKNDGEESYEKGMIDIGKQTVAAFSRGKKVKNMSRSFL